MQIPKRIRLPSDAYANPANAFHVVFRALPETAPFRDAALADAVWALVEAERTRGRVRLLAAVLMPDHLHAVVAPGDSDFVRWVNGFKSFTTRKSWRFGRRSALWQPGFFDRGLRSEADFEEAVLYVLRNPVADGLCTDADDWPWAGCWLDAGG